VEVLLGLLELLLCGAKLLGDEREFLAQVKVIVLVGGDQGLGDL